MGTKHIFYTIFLKIAIYFSLKFFGLVLFSESGSSYMAGQPPASASLMVGSLLGVCHSQLPLESSTAFIT